MKKVNKKIGVNIILITSLLLGGCEDIFEFSPYAANVKDSYLNTDVKNINKLNNSDTGTDTEFKFAIIADSHFRYHELDDAINKINSMKDIDFVIANGDITDNGYLKEYELFHDKMDKLKVPYLTVIGNHDYKSNGEKIYADIYGKFNYTVEYNQCLFIFFDDTFWESNQTPNFTWLEEKLKDSEKYSKTFVVCHQPPNTSQFTDKAEKIYKDLMVKFKVDLSVHGHIHEFRYDEYYDDGIMYLATGPIVYDEFAVVSVNDEVEVSQIKF